MLKGSQPAHVRVREKLLGAIDSGRLAPGAFLPAERDIAEEYGVSRPTVRRALEELSGAGRVVRGEGKRPRVAAPREAASPVRPRRSHVALLSVVPFADVIDSKTSNLSNIVAGIVRGLEPLGVSVIYTNTHAMTLETEEQMRELLEPFYGGIVYLPNEPVPDGPLRALAEAECPSVIVQGFVEPRFGNAHAVDRDDVAGGELATRHLLESGHRRVVHVTYDTDAPWVSARIRGYRKAMRSAAREREQTIRVFTMSSPTMDEKVRILKKRMPRDVEAVFAVNDAMAETVCAWAAATGRRIPDDVSLVGFDNVDAAVERSLTSVSHMSAELGTRVVEVLSEAMRPDAPRIVRREKIEPVLVTRSSVARRTRPSARARTKRKAKVR